MFLMPSYLITSQHYSILQTPISPSTSHAHNSTSTYSYFSSSSPPLPPLPPPLPLLPSSITSSSPLPSKRNNKPFDLFATESLKRRFFMEADFPNAALVSNDHDLWFYLIQLSDMKVRSSREEDLMLVYMCVCVCVCVFVRLSVCVSLYAWR